MKKLILTISLFLLRSLSNGQKVYQFDCALKYHFIFSCNKIDDERIYYINTKDNSYFAEKIPDRNGKFIVYLTDYNGFYGKSVFDAKESGKSTLIFPKTDFFPLLNTYRDHVRDYDFTSSTDTVFQNLHCRKIVFRSIDPKRERKKKLGYSTYFVDPNIPLLPILPLGIDYEVWKTRHNFPDGLVRRRIITDRKAKIFLDETFVEKLDQNFEIMIN